MFEQYEENFEFKLLVKAKVVIEEMWRIFNEEIPETKFEQQNIT